MTVPRVSFGLIVLVGIFGGLNRTSGGEVAVVRNGGPFDNHKVRQVIDPGPNKPSSARAGSSGLVHVYGVNGIVKLRDRAE